MPLFSNFRETIRLCRRPLFNVRFSEGHFFQDGDGEDGKGEDDSPTGMTVGPASRAPSEEDVIFGQAYEIQAGPNFVTSFLINTFIALLVKLP